MQPFQPLTQTPLPTRNSVLDSDPAPFNPDKISKVKIIHWGPVDSVTVGGKTFHLNQVKDVYINGKWKKGVDIGNGITLTVKRSSAKTTLGKLWNRFFGDTELTYHGDGSGSLSNFSFNPKGGYIKTIHAGKAKLLQTFPVYSSGFSSSIGIKLNSIQEHSSGIKGRYQLKVGKLDTGIYRYVPHSKDQAKDVVYGAAAFIGKTADNGGLSEKLIERIALNHKKEDIHKEYRELKENYARALNLKKNIEAIGALKVLELDSKIEELNAKRAKAQDPAQQKKLDSKLEDKREELKLAEKQVRYLKEARDFKVELEEKCEAIEKNLDNLEALVEQDPTGTEAKPLYAATDDELIKDDLTGNGKVYYALARDNAFLDQFNLSESEQNDLETAIDELKLPNTKKNTEAVKMAVEQWQKTATTATGKGKEIVKDPVENLKKLILDSLYQIETRGLSFFV